MISREQIRAARALLDWSQKELAEKSGISEPTIKLVETGKVRSTENTLQSLRLTLEKADIEFLPNNGVRFRDDAITVLEKRDAHDNIYIRLMDDVYYTLVSTAGEVMINFADNARSSQAVIEKQLYLRKSGISMRFLVRDGDTHFLYPLDEYRYLPKGFFINNPILIYKDKVAIIVADENDVAADKIIIIRNPTVTELQKKQFEFFWNSGKAPTKSTAALKA